MYQLNMCTCIDVTTTKIIICTKQKHMHAMQKLCIRYSSNNKSLNVTWLIDFFFRGSNQSLVGPCKALRHKSPHSIMEWRELYHRHIKWGAGGGGGHCTFLYPTTFFQCYTVEPRYNEVLGTVTITLLYRVSHYIGVKKQKYKELGPAKLPHYKRVLLYPTSL